MKLNIDYRKVVKNWEKSLVSYVISFKYAAVSSCYYREILFIRESMC